MSIVLQDIADHVGLSRPTVNQAINGTGRISSETRQRVLTAVEELGYRPNAGAVALRRGQTDTLGVMLVNYRPSPPPSVYGQPVFDYLVAIMDEAAERDFRTLVVRDWQVPTREEIDESVLFRQRCMDGLIYVAGPRPSLENTQRFHHRIDELNKHTIWLDAGRKAPTGCIWRDELGATQLAVRRLFESGHRRIGYVGYLVDEADLTSGDTIFSHYSEVERLQAFHLALSDHGVTGQTYRREHSGGIEEFGRQIMPALTGPDRPTAIIGFDMDLTVELRILCGWCGLSVPEDISLIALDSSSKLNSQWSRLSCVRFDRARIGAAAAGMAIRTARTDQPQVSQCFDQHEIIGQTIAPPP